MYIEPTPFANVKTITIEKHGAKWMEGGGGKPCVREKMSSSPKLTQTTTTDPLELITHMHHNKYATFLKSKKNAQKKKYATSNFYRSMLPFVFFRVFSFFIFFPAAALFCTFQSNYPTVIKTANTNTRHKQKKKQSTPFPHTRAVGRLIIILTLRVPRQMLYHERRSRRCIIVCRVYIPHYYE